MPVRRESNSACSFPRTKISADTEQLWIKQKSIIILQQFEVSSNFTRLLLSGAPPVKASQAAEGTRLPSVGRSGSLVYSEPHQMSLPTSSTALMNKTRNVRSAHDDELQREVTSHLQSNRPLDAKIDYLITTLAKLVKQQIRNEVQEKLINRIKTDILDPIDESIPDLHSRNYGHRR